MSNEQKSILRAKNQSKIEREERELEELMKSQRGEQPEEGEQPSEEGDEGREEPVVEQDEGTAEPEKEEKEPESAEERTFKKRYGDLRRHSQKKEKELQEQINELRAQIESGGEGSAEQASMQYPTSEEDLEAWMNQHPDIAKIVETIAMKKAGEQTKDFESKFAEIEEMRANAAREKAEAELLKTHPDLLEINASDEFHDWIEDQPKWIQDALYDNDTDAKAASRAIDLYKADKGIKKTGKKSPAKEAAKSVNTKGTRSSIDAEGNKAKVRESEVYKMSAQEYEKNHEKILEAQRSGNFIYDMSGSAR